MEDFSTPGYHERYRFDHGVVDRSVDACDFVLVGVDTAFRDECDSSLRIRCGVLTEVLELVVFILVIPDVAIAEDC